MWATPANGFKCYNNLNDLTTHYVNPCTAIKKAADTWNDVSESNWYLAYTRGTAAPIHNYIERPLDHRNAGETTLLFRQGKIVGADVVYNPNVCFEDSSNKNSPGNCYDMESIALHELGHTQSVHHEWWNSVMVDNIDPGTQQRTLFAHDIDVLEARYPK